MSVLYDEPQEHDNCSLEFDARVYSDRLLREFLDQAIIFMRAAARYPEAELDTLIEAEGVSARLRNPRCDVDAH